MTGLSPWDLGVVTSAALCVGLAKAGLGGLGMVAVVLMALVMPARESTGALLTLLIVGDFFAIVAYRRHAVWPVIWRLLPPAVLGIIAGVWLMPRLGEGNYGAVIGWTTLVLLGVLVIQRRSAKLSAVVASQRWAGWLAGAAGGIATMLANAAGPVMTIYLLACRLPKMAFVGTAAWFFCIVNLTKVPFSIGLGLITWQSLLLTVLLSPVVVAGGLGGRWVLGRIDQRLFEILLLGFAALAAVRLIFG
ncbi:MAG: sulfite exporter TauE/SafE family protein [Chthoniobacterales bacterium]